MNVIKCVVGKRNSFSNVSDTELYIGGFDGFWKDAGCINAMKFWIGVCFSHLQGPSSRPTAWVQHGDALLQQLSHWSVIVTSTQTEHKVRIDIFCTLDDFACSNTVVMRIEESSVVDALYLPLSDALNDAHVWPYFINLFTIIVARKQIGHFLVGVVFSSVFSELKLLILGGGCCYCFWWGSRHIRQDINTTIATWSALFLFENNKLCLSFWKKAL